MEETYKMHQQTFSMADLSNSGIYSFLLRLASLVPKEEKSCKKAGGKKNCERQLGGVAGSARGAEASPEFPPCLAGQSGKGGEKQQWGAW